MNFGHRKLRSDYDILLFTGGRSNRIYPYFQKLASHSRHKIRVLALWDLPWFYVPNWKSIPCGELSHLVKLRMIATSVKHGTFYGKWFILQRLRFAEGCLLWILYDNYLRRHPSNLIGVWNGVGFRSKILVMVAHRLKRRVIYFENGILPNSTTLDDSGVNARCCLPQDANFYMSRKTSRSLVAQNITNRHADVTPDLPKRYVFIPFQGEADFQLLLHSKWIRTMKEFLAVLRQTVPLLKDDKMQFVIKRHPKAVITKHLVDFYDQQKNLKNICFRNSCSTETLIRQSLAVITINSMVGMQAIAMGKPVITLEAACYSIQGLASHAGSIKELADMLNAMPDRKDNTRLRERFLSYVESCYCIPEAPIVPKNKFSFGLKKQIKIKSYPSEKHWQAVDERLGKMINGASWLPGVPSAY